MSKQIKELPLELQKLFEEFKAEKDAIEASESDYVIQPTNEDVLDEYQRLDSVIEEENEDADYDEYDENTYDMNYISPYMKSAFNEDDEDSDQDNDYEFDE